MSSVVAVVVVRNSFPEHKVALPVGAHKPKTAPRYSVDTLPLWQVEGLHKLAPELAPHVHYPTVAATCYVSIVWAQARGAGVVSHDKGVGGEATPGTDL